MQFREFGNPSHVLEDGLLSICTKTTRNVAVVAAMLSPKLSVFETPRCARNGSGWAIQSPQTLQNKGFGTDPGTLDGPSRARGRGRDGPIPGSGWARPGPGVVGPGLILGVLGGVSGRFFVGVSAGCFSAIVWVVFLSVSAVEAQHPKLSPRQLKVPCAAST